MDMTLQVKICVCVFVFFGLCSVLAFSSIILILKKLLQQLICSTSSMAVFLCIVHWLDKDSHSFKCMQINTGTFLSLICSLVLNNCKILFILWIIIPCWQNALCIASTLNLSSRQCGFSMQNYADRIDLNKIRIGWKAMPLHTLNYFVPVCDCGNTKFESSEYALHYLIIRDS